MPRIRTIKPEFFTSLTIASLPIEARLTFIGLWTQVDDEGRCVNDARLIKAALWTLDDRLTEDVVRDLGALTEASLITQYEVGERRYLAVCNWSEHQRINRPTKSTLPGPDHPDAKPLTCTFTSLTEPSVRAQASLTEGSLGERKGKEGNNYLAPGKPAASGRPQRPVDEVWDAVMAVCGMDSKSLTKSARGAANSAVKELRDAGATANDVRRRADAYRRTYKEASLTPTALAKHWPQLGNVPTGGNGAPTVSTPNGEFVWDEYARAAFDQWLPTPPRELLGDQTNYTAWIREQRKQFIAERSGGAA